MRGWSGYRSCPGADHDDIKAMVQAPGTALRADGRALREKLERNPGLRALLRRHALFQHGQVARIAACNGRHRIDQRLGRWLLMAHDRADGDSFLMTHEVLST
ncbi:hypothetical protein [Dankookia sp. P2]|uniref:hypothetical protein n=1 Tax=Dankookia sp. P2 TaxID=3423955 RepID=UPI003D66F86A